jgi:hypothetical protein
MLDRARRLFPAVFLICIALFYANEIWRSSKRPHPPTTKPGAEHSQYQSKHDNIFADAWNWTTQDPVSFYTSVLALFTGALVIVSAIQIRFLIRAEITARRAAIAARRSAIAARKSAEHIPRVERAYIRGGTGWQRRIDAGAQMFVTMNNYGKTPAFIGTITVSTCREDDLPAVPQYETGVFRGYVLATNTDHEKAFCSDVSCIWDLQSGQVVFGRIWYRDIFDDCHSSGFILHLRDGLPGVAGHDPYWEDRDERDLGPAAREAS